MNKTQRKRVISLVKTLLMHRRNGKAQQESAAYDKLFLYCHEHNFDFSSCMKGAIQWLKDNDIAASMNGLV